MRRKDYVIGPPSHEDGELQIAGDGDALLRKQPRELLHAEVRPRPVQPRQQIRHLQRPIRGLPAGTGNKERLAAWQWDQSDPSPARTDPRLPAGIGTHQEVPSWQVHVFFAVLGARFRVQD